MLSINSQKITFELSLKSVLSLLITNEQFLCANPKIIAIYYIKYMNLVMLMTVRIVNDHGQIDRKRLVHKGKNPACKIKQLSHRKR